MNIGAEPCSSHQAGRFKGRLGEDEDVGFYIKRCKFIWEGGPNVSQRVE